MHKKMRARRIYKPGGSEKNAKICSSMMKIMFYAAASSRRVHLQHLVHNTTTAALRDCPEALGHCLSLFWSLETSMWPVHGQAFKTVVYILTLGRNPLFTMQSRSCRAFQELFVRTLVSIKLAYLHGCHGMWS